MTPQPWFVLAGLLFLLALIASVALVLAVIWVVLRGAALALTLDQHTDHTDQAEQDPAAVLGQLLTDLATHQRRYRPDDRPRWDAPPVIEVTDLGPTSRRRRGR